MTYFYEELVIMVMGAFVYFSAKKCKIYPIPVKTEIFGMLIGLVMVWLICCYRDISFLKFSEYCRFALLGYLPMRVVCWVKGKKG
jgi:hypothetical protein